MSAHDTTAIAQATARPGPIEIGYGLDGMDTRMLGFVVRAAAVRRIRQALDQQGAS